ncbi:hypothetical protein GGF37_006879, partial [Kickxella alabastrina]
MTSATQEALSRNLQLRSSAVRTRAAAVDLELRRLDADQAAEQLRMTEPFVPDAFFAAGEAAALRTLLAFRRLAAKADILCGQLESDERAGAVSDDFVAAADVRAQLARLSAAAALVAAGLAVASDAAFVRGGALLHDAAGAERRLDGLLALLRREEFRAQDALPEVRRLAAQAAALADAHVPAAAATAQRIEAHAAAAAFGADVQLANLVYAQQLLAAHDAGLASAAAAVALAAKAAKGGALRLLRRARELNAAGLVASPEAAALAARIAQASGALAEYAARLRLAVQDTAAAGGGAAARLALALASIAQDVFGARADAGMAPALAAAQQLAADLAAVLPQLEGAQPPAAPAGAPWVRRAAAFKASLVQNADVERRTGALHEEIVSLARELKLRDQALQESA